MALRCLAGVAASLPALHLLLSVCTIPPHASQLGAEDSTIRFPSPSLELGHLGLLSLSSPWHWALSIRSIP
jgi:hypothetical protein